MVVNAGCLVTAPDPCRKPPAAVGTPVAALFGPTDPVKTGPYGSKHKVLTAGDDCSPCFRKDCDTVKCLAGLSVEQVYETVKEMVYADR